MASDLEISFEEELKSDAPSVQPIGGSGEERYRHHGIQQLHLAVQDLSILDPTRLTACFVTRDYFSTSNNQYRNHWSCRSWKINCCESNFWCSNCQIQK
jgi:hypothetical protein